MKYLIVIPARGGSKGIPLKNIYPLNGKPLLIYSLELIRQVDFEGDVVVSTDSSKIKEIALSIPDIQVVDRPKDISGDKASTESALIHALDIMENSNKIQYDAVMTLQATSPLRRPKMLQDCFIKYEQERKYYDALVTLTETYADYWIREKKGFRRLYPNAPRRRQDRKPIYVENSAVYITDSNSLRETKSVLGYVTNGFVISEEESVDINEYIDLLIAEELLKRRKK